MRDAAAAWIGEASAVVLGKVAWLAFFQVVHGACGVTYALMLRRLVDSAVKGDATVFVTWVGATALLLAAQLALRAAMRWLSELCRASLENCLKLRLFDTLLHRDLDRVTAVHSGEWMNRLTSDTRVVAEGVTDIVPGAVGMASRLVGALAAAMWLDPRVTIVLFPGGLALVVLSLIFRRVLRRLHRRIQEADGHLRTFLQDRLGSLLTVRSFVAEAPTLAGATALADDHLAARMRRNHFSNLANVGLGTAMGAAQLGTVIWCGYGILTGAMSFGTLTAMTQLVGQLQAPLANISGLLPRWYAMLGSAERLAEAETLPIVNTKALPLPDVLRFYDGEFAAVGLESVSYAYWPATGTVVDMHKDADAPSVCGLSLEVRRNEFLALSGPSGCGKSTALRLLMGAYAPDAGKRYLTTRNGEREAFEQVFRRLFAYVPQGNQLLGSNVREAVSLGGGSSTGDDASLWEALRVACADTFVTALEGGLDTPLGERGAGLSEGQMQRIAVARAVYSGSPILLLDEATSALDEATEAQLLRNLRAMRGRTVVIVTHRHAALEVCDRVIDFDGEGTHERT